MLGTIVTAANSESEVVDLIRDMEERYYKNKIQDSSRAVLVSSNLSPFFVYFLVELIYIPVYYLFICT